MNVPLPTSWQWKQQPKACPRRVFNVMYIAADTVSKLSDGPNSTPTFLQVMEKYGIP